MSTTDITPYRNATLTEKRAYVQTLAAAGELLPRGLWANVRNEKTGLMENHPSPGKIMLIVETGLMLGLHPMAALQGIDVIEGNPTLKPALMSALIRDAGHVLRIEQTGTVERGDLAVTVTGIRKDDPEFPYIYTWTPHDAIRAGLVDSYEPDADGVWHVRARSKDGKVLPWEAYTPRMCRWRALGDVASAGFEDVLMGMHYTPEEMGAVVNADGEVVDSTPQPEPSEDWPARIEACKTKDQLKAVKELAGDEWNDDLNLLMLTHYGMLNRGEIEAPAPDDSDVVDADVAELTPADEAAMEALREKLSGQKATEPERDPAEPTPEEYAQIEAERAEQESAQS